MECHPTTSNLQVPHRGLLWISYNGQWTMKNEILNCGRREKERSIHLSHPLETIPTFFSQSFIIRTTFTSIGLPCIPHEYQISSLAGVPNWRYATHIRVLNEVCPGTLFVRKSNQSALVVLPIGFGWRSNNVGGDPDFRKYCTVAFDIAFHAGITEHSTPDLESKQYRGL
jgi:hypothetical protein